MSVVETARLTIQSPVEGYCTVGYNIKKTLRSTTRAYCDSYESKNKQQLFPYAVLTECFFNNRDGVFTARYQLNL
jgi:hypothetical protein